MSKIVFFSPYLPKHAGGGERYLFDCARILSEEGWQVFVAISRQEPLSKKEILAIKNKYESFLNYSLEKINFIITPLATDANFFKKLFWTAKFDVCYYQTDGSLFFSLARKNVLHIQVPLKLDKSSLLERLKLANWRVKNTNSIFTKKYIEKFWQTKINYVHQPYVNAEEFLSQADELLGKPVAKEKIILSVGRFFSQLHNKRQDVLITFFKDLVALDPAALKGWKLILVGENEDQDLAKQLVVAAKGFKIEIIHDISRVELVKIYRKASFYWHATGYEIDEDEHPEKVEHFGISTLEAMASKALPIVINKGGQKEIIGSRLKNCLWDSEAECLSKTLELINNDLQRAELANLAYERSLFFSEKRFKAILLAMVRVK